MIDWSQVLQSLLNGLGWGIGFAVPFFVGIGWLLVRILTLPTVRKLANAAEGFSKGKTDGVTTVGLKILDKLWPDEPRQPS